MNTYCVDFEFRHEPGHVPRPWCVVAMCCETKEVVRLWLDGNTTSCPFTPPYRMVAHYALAELTCFVALGWPMPDEVVDTLAEVRTVRGQHAPFGGWGLLHLANSFGISTMTSEHKEAMHTLAMGDTIPHERREELLEYCQDDVDALVGVGNQLEPLVDLPLAALRGRYLAALAKVENRGIPVDVELVDLLQTSADNTSTAAPSD